MKKYLQPSFPDTVDEVSARLVGFGVVLQALLYLVVRSPISLLVLAVGFALRVHSGPRYSPLALLVTRVVRPRLTRIAERNVTGAPKRFAQGVGLTFAVSALIAHLAGAGTVAFVLIAGLTFAASLEAFAGLCLGCIAFRYLMRAGVIPDSVCESCNDITAHLAARAAALNLNARTHDTQAA